MEPFKFTQSSWKHFLLFSLINYPLTRWSISYFGFGLVAALVVLVIGIPLFLWLSKYFKASVTFKDSFLVLQKGLDKKEVKIEYAHIQNLTFKNNASREFYVSTAEEKINLPSPANLQKVENLFNWLKSKNLVIDLKIILPE